MGSKNISVREDVYRALQHAKGEDESFSDVIERLIESGRGDHPLYGLVGVLDESGAERVRERATGFRESVDDQFDAES